MIKSIQDFSNYTISTKGIVRNEKTDYIKSQWKGASGYLHVDLQQDGVRKKIAVHRLLAMHFIPNPDNKRTVNHIDGNKLNNSIDNLEWATDGENIQHAYDTGLQSKESRRKTKQAEADKLFTERVMTGTTITALAKELSVSLSQLSIRMKEAALRLDMEQQYKEELYRQKCLRQQSRK